MTQHLTEYADASPEVRAIYDDIESLKEIMAPGALANGYRVPVDEAFKLP